MHLSRRSLLQATAALTLAPALAHARGLVADATYLNVIAATLDAAKRAGASYADLRIHRRRDEGVRVRDDHVESINDAERFGVGVRVLVNGAWGFASSPVVTVKEGARLAQVACALAKANAAVITRKVELAPNPAHVDVWQTPLQKDPFKIPVADKAELLLAVCEKLRAVKGINFCEASLSTRLEWKLFASSDGALIEQSQTRIGPDYSATAIHPTTGEFVSRSWDGQPLQAGWEHLETSHFLEDTTRVAEEAVQKLNSLSVEPGKKDLILDASNLWLTIHESVGHPTELDRALGYEANMAGTSFATIDTLGTQYAAPLVTLYADKTTPGGLATCGYDDDGVRTQRWNLVEKGKFVGYQTTREQAGWIGEKASRGCSYAQDHASVPFQRMPNVSLAPGEKDLSVLDLIKATDDGIYVVGTGSWSIDHQRYNFQFTGQMFFEVKKGKVTRSLKDVGYQSNTPAFWKSCDLLGGPSSVRMGSAFDDGKGEPMQSNPVSHACPPARFRGVSVINSASKKGG
ncbi:MAG: TldD/PmbA family protein [Archangium sp.]|nr:TldD/PmbA family protein [Archangium sp.]MDP3571438.1 TldD/PmbA family protein [Archangium sp.]